MNSLLILIPISLIFLGIAIWTFFWAVKKNQFEDLERHGNMVLWEDDDLSIKEKSSIKESSSNISAQSKKILPKNSEDGK